MVEEVVGNIIEAEDRAEQIKKEGKEQAKAVLAQAQVNSDARRAACIKECRALSEEQKKLSSQKAEEVYAEVLQSGKAQAQKLRSDYEKNTEKAVAAVVSALIG